MKPLFSRLLLPIVLAGPVQAAPPRPNVLLADFEGKDYGNWRTTGTAFGTSPA